MRVKWALARFSALCAPEERLEAELALAPEMTMPADLKARTGAQDAKGVWEGQISQFESRVISLEGQREVIREKIAQLEHQIRGTEAVLRPTRRSWHRFAESPGATSRWSTEAWQRWRAIPGPSARGRRSRDRSRRAPPS